MKGFRPIAIYKPENFLQRIIGPVDRSPGRSFCWWCRSKLENEIEKVSRCSKGIFECLGYFLRDALIFEFDQTFVQFWFRCLQS
jgi:hypothetical protein